MQQINRLINLDTLELFVYIQPFYMIFIWYAFICLHCILFVFKDFYFNEKRLSEIKYFRFSKFVRSPTLYFWCSFLCCCTYKSPFLYCCMISLSATWLSVEYHFCYFVWKPVNKLCISTHLIHGLLSFI